MGNQVHLDRKCTGEVIAFSSQIHGVTPRDLTCSVRANAHSFNQLNFDWSNCTVVASYPGLFKMISRTEYSVLNTWAKIGAILKPSKDAHSESDFCFFLFQQAG